MTAHGPEPLPGPPRPSGPHRSASPPNRSRPGPAPPPLGGYVTGHGVALYRIFHTLFSSFFSGSSMVHLWLITSTVHLLALLRRFCFFLLFSRLVCGGMSCRLGSSARRPGDASCCLLLCPSAGSCGASSAGFPGSSRSGILSGVVRTVYIPVRVCG